MVTSSSVLGVGDPEFDRSVGAAVAGTSAVGLLSAFRSDPHRALRVGVVGPGGSGKSALLAALAVEARRAGLGVHAVRAVADVPRGEADGPPTGLVLVDDAHACDTDTLAALLPLAADPTARLVVAARPAPSPPGLGELALALGRARTPVVLGPLDAESVRRRVAAIAGQCPAELGERVATLTGGSLLLVDRVAAAVRDAGPAVLGSRDAGSGTCADGVPPLPAGVDDLLRAALDALDGPVRRLLLGVAVCGAVSATPPGRAALADLLDVGPAELDELASRGQAAGLLIPDAAGSEHDVGALAPLVRSAVVDRAPRAERLSLTRELAARALGRGDSVLAVARQLSGAGLHGQDLAELFAAAGDEALTVSPDVAGVLYTDAVVAGAPSRELRVRRAAAAALDADLDRAMRLADPVTAETEAPERERALLVLACVMAQRGLVAEAAAMLAGHGGGLGRLAVPALVVTGHADRARAELAAPTTAPDTGPVGSPLPSTLRSAHDLMADGVVASVGPTPGAALSLLTRAASLLEPVGPVVLVPDSPAALAALVAAHGGELEVGDSVLRRALATGLGGRVAVTRHRLLRAWIAMLRGETAAVRDALAPVGPAQRRIEPRDEIVAAALEVGLARRLGDTAALRAAWPRAREACVRHPVDLGVLAPVGEIAVAAARLGELGVLRDLTEQVEELLDRLGDPPLWRTVVAWHLHGASVLVDDRPGAQRHARVLAALAPRSALAAALAAAARVRLEALAGRVDAAETQAAVSGLHRVGWTSDAAGLAGEAAERAGDRKAAATLLACARALGDPAGAVVGVLPDPDESVLSDREREVAHLLLAGLTYKQIGARLYISAKTVEHHVARMRKRLDSDSRGELFARLRMLLGDPSPMAS